MTNFEKRMVVMTLFVLITTTMIDASFVYTDRSQALSSYENAKNSIEIAVNKVSTLHNLGINITSLKISLNQALVSLDSSRRNYIKDEYEASLAYSADAQKIASEIIVEEARLRVQINKSNTLQKQLFIASFEILVFSVIIFYVWHRVRKYYISRLLLSKPEVKTYES